MTKSAPPTDQNRRPLHTATPEERQKIFKQAVALHEQGKLQEAALIYRALLKVDSNYAPIWLNLGTLLRKQGKFHAAAACAEKAVGLSPDNPSFLTNFGNCMVDLDKPDAALAAHERAVSLRPDDALIQCNHAIALREFGKFEEAIKAFDAAIALKPDDVNMQWDRAITYLHMGKFKEGWDAFEIRWHQKQARQERHYEGPQWQGEDLSGKTILVYEEQGFGDTILCSRYIPLIKQRGGRVMLECKKALHRLFANIEGLDALVAETPAAGSYDYHVPMMSLPGIFKTDETNIPTCATLTAAPEVPAEAARLLALGEGKLRVGIVWSGSLTFGRNRKRAVSLERFLPLAGIPGVQCYSLQKGPCEKDLAEQGAEGLILPLGAHVDDFADTAAVLQQLDLIIMTDSSVAHLAASLGRPVWNLLGSFAYWLYLHDREDSPWYPTMKLFRQQKPGDWDGVFEKVERELKKLVSGIKEV